MPPSRYGFGVWCRLVSVFLSTPAFVWEDMAISFGNRMSRTPAFDCDVAEAWTIESPRLA